MVMTADQVMTHRDTMRLQPPDILLTNYKMLDYLMIRPRLTHLSGRTMGQRPLSTSWLTAAHLRRRAGYGPRLPLAAAEGPAQGAEGASVLCRYLRDPGWSGAYRATAGVCQPDLWRSLDTDAVVGESMLQPQEFFGESLIDMTSRVPEPEQADDLRAEHFAEVHAYLQRQAELWWTWRARTWARLPGAWRWASACSHTCSSATSLSCSTVACPPWTNSSQTSDGLSGADKLDRGYWYGLLVSMLALISTALVKSTRTVAHPDHFCRYVCNSGCGSCGAWSPGVGTVPVMRFADDLTPDQHRHHLPLVHCRECGEDWLVRDHAAAR